MKRIRRRSSAHATIAAAALSIAAGSVQVHAQNSVTGYGAAGNPGVPGTVVGITPQNGGAGGTGSAGDASAVSGDQSNTATAYGGAGGNGGDGTSYEEFVSDGGSGGDGGNASANAAQNSSAPQTSTMQVGSQATANGANGAIGGNGGTAKIGPETTYGFGGNGGDGGSATASASALSTSESPYDEPVTAEATASGGNGGPGGTQGGNGGNGGGASVSSVSASVDEGPGPYGLPVGVPVTAIATATGGNGGTGVSGGTGGNGGSVTLDNVVSASETYGNPFTLDQSAIGGNSGGSTGGSPGTPGSATVETNYTDTSGASLTFSDSSLAGYGGACYSTNGSAGGNAQASFIVNGSGDINAVVDVNYAPLGATPYGEGSSVTTGVGSGGAGGNASEGSVSVTSSSGSIVLQSNIIGGEGGSAAPGGAYGGNGNGGAGGDASAASQTVASPASSGFYSVTDALFVQAGSGGNATGAGNSAGSGGIASAAAFNLSSASGAVTATLSLINGIGGSGSNGANGGNGASQSLTNAITASGGTLILTQIAGAGSAGWTDTGTPGVAGNASSTLNFSYTAASSGAVTANTTAYAGSGGSTEIGNASAGGSATAYTSITGFGYVTATATAAGGNGGNVSGSGNGGAGNIGSATAIAVGGFYTIATATANGGEGGQGSGAGSVNGANGPGLANASATSTDGYAVATAVAAGPSPVATASAFSPAWAQGTATTTGVSSTATSAATVTPGTGLILSGKATTSQAGGNASSNVQAVYNPSAFPTSSQLAASSAYVVASPDSSNVTNAWQYANDVQSAFADSAANVNALEFADSVFSGGPTTTTLEVIEDNSQLNSSDLLLGLSNVQFQDGGFALGDVLQFQVQRNGITLVNQTFTDDDYAAEYFRNGVLNLGSTNADLQGNNLDLVITFDFTSPNPGDGVSANLLLGTNGNPTGVWNVNASSSWANPTSWTGDLLPDGPGTSATFGSIITSPATVTLDENTTVGSMTFSNTNSYTISPGAGSYSLTLDNAGAAASVAVTAGNHTISAPIILTSAGLDVAIASGETLTTAGKITGSAPLALSGTGTLKFGPGIGEVDLTSLTIAAGATLDLTNNHIILDYTSSDPISTIAGYLKSGYNNGRWNGPGIISSTAQGLTDGHAYGVGWADGKDGVVHGLSSGQIEIKYTLLGDANLDGTVNGSDFSILAANFGLGATNWDQGNFLYGSSVNGSDFSALAANFGQGDSGAAVAVSPADIAALDSFAIANGLPLPTIGAVPDPTTGGLVAMAGLGVMARRRRR